MNALRFRRLYQEENIGYEVGPSQIGDTALLEHYNVLFLA